MSRLGLEGIELGAFGAGLELEPGQLKPGGGKMVAQDVGVAFGSGSGTSVIAGAQMQQISQLQR
jgi:hypothetical protein